MLAAQAIERRLVNDLVLTAQLDPMRADQMLRESELTGLALPEILLANDLISEEELARTYAQHTGLRYVDLARRDISESWALSIPENLARRVDCLALGGVGKQLTVAVADPVDPRVRAAVLGQVDCLVTWVVSPRWQIRRLHDRIYGAARQRGTPEVKAPVVVPEAATAVADLKPVGPPKTTAVAGLSVVELLDEMLDEAMGRQASNVHVEPVEDRVRIRMRVEGRLVEWRVVPREMLSPLIGRLKGLSRLNFAQQRVAQEGRFDYHSLEHDIHVRVAIIPTAHGERVTLGLQSKRRALLELTALGMEPGVQQQFEALIRRAHGLVLVAGPIGSGRTSTLYAAVRQINPNDKHVVTIESPVECRIPGVNQVQVDLQHELAFANALRSVLRHDPDVIMVGEVGDLETARVALEASLSRYLILASLGALSAAGAITRLLDMGCEPYLVANGLIGVIAQRLVRRICQQCKTPYAPDDNKRHALGLPAEQVDVQLYRGKGCDHCRQSGYHDRVGIFEHLHVDAGLVELIKNRAPAETMQQYATEHGMHTLQMDAAAKTLAGLTTLEEALRVTAADTP